MDETNPTNQEGTSSNQAEAEGQKLEKLEHEIEELEKKAAAPPAEPTPPPTSPEQAPPVTGKSKIILWAGLGLLLLALIAAGAYSLASRKAVPTPTPTLAATPSQVAVSTPTPDPTADWKTYRSEKLSVEFKHPKDWNVQEEPLALTNLTNTLIITIASVDMTVIGISYCEANLQDSPRCELSTKENTAIIDWGEDGSFEASTLLGVTSESGVSVILETNPDISARLILTSENKNLFRTFLSTFKFIEATPEASPTSSP